MNVAEVERRKNQEKFSRGFSPTFSIKNTRGRRLAF